MKANFIILDEETGSLDEERSPITQIALQIVDPIKLESTFDFDTFVKPYNNLVITKEALAGSRVTMTQIKTGMESSELMKYLITIFKGANRSGKEQTRPIIVGHNVPFDLKFLVYLFKFHNKDLYDFIQRIVFDTLWLCKIFEAGSLRATENSKFNLTACCERMGIELHGAHGAPADVEATRLLFTKLIKNFRNANATDNSASDSAPKSRRSAVRENFFFEF